MFGCTLRSVWGDTPPERRLSSHASLSGFDSRRGSWHFGDAHGSVEHATTHPPRPLRRAADEGDPRGGAGRVLFCTWAYPPDRSGGAEHQARLQAEELARRGFTVEVACPRWPGTRSGRLNGVRVRRLPFIDRRRLRTVSYGLALFCFLLWRLPRFHLVHVHLAYFQADVAVLAARIVRRPVWVKVAASGRLGEIDRMRRAATWTRYVGLRGAKVVQAVSQPVAQEVRAIGVHGDRVVRLANGVDTVRFSPVPDHERPALRDALGLPAAGVLVLYAGRFARHKGMEDLLAAWRRACPPDAALVLVGSTDTMEPVAIPPADDVIVRGWTTEIVVYYRAVDAFVLPSHTEGMSNAVLEAMSCGLPVVATRVGAASEMIRDGLDGMLVEPGDRAGLAAALASVVSDAGLRARLGAAAAAGVRSQYAIEHVVDRLERGYRRAGLGPRHPQR